MGALELPPFVLTSKVANVRRSVAMQSGPEASSAVRAEDVDPVLGRARCELSGGSGEVAYVGQLTPQGAVLIGLSSLIPGTLLSVEFEVGPVRIPPLSAQVIGMRRASDGRGAVEHSIRFRAMSAAARDALTAALAERPDSADAVGAVAVNERRDRPRVWFHCPAVAILTVGAAEWIGSVVSLSHGGAFVAVDLSHAHQELVPGGLLHLDIALHSVPERLSLQARVVRFNGPAEPAGIGVRFVDPSALTRARVDGVVRYVQGS